MIVAANLTHNWNITENYKFLPLKGLFELSKDELSNADILSLANFAEEKIKSSPSGRVYKLALLFYLIKILKEAKIDFLVKGGILLQYHLNEKARETSDLDIIISDDIDRFYNQVEEVFAFNNIKIKKFKKEPADGNFYYDTFNFELELSNKSGNSYLLTLDGISNKDIYDKVPKEKLLIPDIISGDFIATPVEYVMAEKVIAITNELPRPYKHLIDVYSLIHSDINVATLKLCLNLILDNDNQARKNIGRKVKEYRYYIREDKYFAGSFILNELQAGYTLPYEEMREEINQWMEKNL